MAKTYKELVDKCLEKPNRPVYFIEQCFSVNQNGPTFLNNINADSPMSISCKYADMEDIAYYINASGHPYRDPPPVQTHKETVNLHRIESIERIGDQVCIFTPNAVYSTADFSLTYAAAAKELREKLQRQEDLQELRKALESADTIFKTDLKQFCRNHGIGFTKIGLIGPKEELDAIVDAMKKCIEERGIDLKSISEISYEDFRAIIDAGAKIHATIEHDQEVEKQRPLVEKLLSYNKPIIEAKISSIMTAETKTYDITKAECKNVIASLSLYGHPFGRKGEADLHMVGAVVKDISQLPNKLYIIETGSALLVDTSEVRYSNNPRLPFYLREAFVKYHEENGLSLVPYHGRSGIYHELAQYNNGGKSIFDDTRTCSQTKADQYEIHKSTASTMLELESDSYGLYQITSSRSIVVIDANGMAHDIKPSDILPGDKIRVTSADPLGSNEYEIKTMTVLDCEPIDRNGEEMVIATDYGIFTNSPELVQELSITRAKVKAEIETQEQDTPGNR